MIIKEHTGNGEQEKPYMDIGGRETQDMGTQVWQLLPPPERCIPHRTPSNGEGGGCSGGLKGHGDSTGGLQGCTCSGTHGGAGSSGGHGGSGSSGGHGGGLAWAANGRSEWAANGGGLAWAANGGSEWAVNGGWLAGAANSAVNFPTDGGLRRAADGSGLGRAVGGWLALALNGGGLGRAADDGGLVLARARTLPRFLLSNLVQWCLGENYFVHLFCIFRD